MVVFGLGSSEGILIYTSHGSCTVVWHVENGQVKHLCRAPSRFDKKATAMAKRRRLGTRNTHHTLLLLTLFTTTSASCTWPILPHEGSALRYISLNLRSFKIILFFNVYGTNPHRLIFLVPPQSCSPSRFYQPTMMILPILEAQSTHDAWLSILPSLLATLCKLHSLQPLDLMLSPTLF